MNGRRRRDLSQRVSAQRSRDRVIPSGEVRVKLAQRPAGIDLSLRRNIGQQVVQHRARLVEALDEFLAFVDHVRSP